MTAVDHDPSFASHGQTDSTRNKYTDPDCGGAALRVRQTDAKPPKGVRQQLRF
jgi:hypothetical protein